MKGFLAVIGLLLSGTVNAQVVAPQQVTNVEQTFKSTMTCTSLLVSSATAAAPTGQSTQIIASTNTLWGSITIQNKDTTANVYISDSINVTSGTANGVLNANTGFEIGAGAPGASASFYLAPGMLLYGVNDSGSRATVITTCKGR